MKHIIKLYIAIISYASLVLFVDWILGIGLNDQWDRLMSWSKKVSQ